MWDSSFQLRMRKARAHWLSGSGLRTWRRVVSWTVRTPLHGVSPCRGDHLRISPEYPQPWGSCLAWGRIRNPSAMSSLFSVTNDVWLPMIVSTGNKRASSLKYSRRAELWNSWTLKWRIRRWRWLLVVCGLRGGNLGKVGGCTCLDELGWAIQSASE